MKLFVLTLLCASSLCATAQTKASWPKEPSAVFGIEFGVPLPNDQISECGGVKVETEKSRIAACALTRPSYGGFSISGLPTPEFDGGHVSRDSNDVVTSILLTAKHVDYQSVKALLTERYGKPTRSITEKVQTKAGSTFNSQVTSWVGKRVSLVLTERAGTIDTTSAFFSHNESLTKESEARDRSIKDSASKL